MSADCCKHQHDLEFRNVSAHYGNMTVLSDINFSVSCGNRLAIIGPNGAGKSTLLRILAGIKKHSAGDILWQQQPLSQWSKETASRHPSTRLPYHRQRNRRDGALPSSQFLAKVQ